MTTSWNDVDLVAQGDTGAHSTSLWNASGSCDSTNGTDWISTTCSSATASTTAPPRPTPSGPSGNTPRADGGCNESLIHSNAEKAVFHATKGAKRLLDEGQYEEALRIAGNAGRAHLATEGLEYDADRSEKHLAEKVIDRLVGSDDTDEIRAGIEKAWRKIDGGNHKGGARVAIATADEYLEDFTPP